MNFIKGFIVDKHPTDTVTLCPHQGHQYHAPVTDEEAETQRLVRTQFIRKGQKRDGNSGLLLKTHFGEKRLPDFFLGDLEDSEGDRKKLVSAAHSQKRKSSLLGISNDDTELLWALWGPINCNSNL